MVEWIEVIIFVVAAALFIWLYVRKGKQIMREDGQSQS
jgi:hypothetical protein